MRKHLVAVDIGTASARAGIFDGKGTLLAKSATPFGMLRTGGGEAEHDSEEIWQAVCASVNQALAASGSVAADVAAIGFDATCSLVIRGGDDGRRALTRKGDKIYDTIAWLDHRAMHEAEDLSRINHLLVQRAGGRISPEMAIPKLLWLKRHRPDLWEGPGEIMDLADFATRRASGMTKRSVSPLASKWSYLPDGASGWDATFLECAGLSDLQERTGAPDTVAEPGQSLGPLDPRAAAELGLDSGCQVAAGMIDAYAGVLGLLGGLNSTSLRGNVALIAGTSSCLAWLSAQEPDPRPAFWGPYRDVAVPGLWLMEGGQSAAGALLDHIVRMHAAGGEPDAVLYDRIIDRISELKEKEGERLGHPMDILPDFHGNRSPLGDPAAWGMASGLSLDTSFDGLCRLYWRAAVGIACGLRQILEKVEEANGPSGCLHMAGGHTQNPLLVALYADVTGLPLAVPRTADAVLLGTAMNAAASAGLYGSVAEAAARMAPERVVHHPDPARRRFHEKDYQRHLLMLRHRSELQALYAEA